MSSDKFCTECGHSIAQSDKFCSSCGHKLPIESKGKIRFLEATLQGRIGEAIVEVILLHFKYDIEHSGGEISLGTQVMREMVGMETEDAVDLIRRKPDFNVQNRNDDQENFQVEVKSTSMSLSHWEYSKDRIERCQDLYPESIWVVCSIPDFELYAKKISDLDISDLTDGRFGKKIINVYEQFQPIENVFSNITPEELGDAIQRIKLRISNLFYS